MKNKRTWTSKNRRNQSGQAMIEYILLMVVTITLVMGLMLQFFRPMQVFIKGFMGTYVQCLLETGELPALGGPNNMKDSSGCMLTWEQAIVQGKGDPTYLERSIAKDGIKGGGSKGRTGSGGSGSGDSAGGKGGKKGSGSGSEGNEQAGSGSYAGSSSRGKGRGLFDRSSSRPGADGGGASGQNDKTVTIALNDGNGKDKFFKVRDFASVQDRSKKAVLDMSMLSQTEREKVEKENKASSRVIASEPGMRKPEKRVMIKKEQEKPKVVAPEEPMTFGNYFRIFFIICIIILLVILLGGQALQISKGWEK